MSKKQMVYVAGPYTAGHVGENVRDAVLAGYRLRGEGVHIVPVIPHLFHLAHTISPRSYDYWMSWDDDLLTRCDALLRLPGYSKGSDIEIERAKELGLPVFYRVETCISWAVGACISWEIGGNDE